MAKASELLVTGAVSALESSLQLGQVTHYTVTIRTLEKCVARCLPLMSHIFIVRAGEVELRPIP